MAQSNLFPLKLLVISLGVVLIGGTVCLFGTIATKAGKSVSASHCPDATVHLGENKKIAGITPQGDTVQITLADPPKVQLITADRCSGKILQTLDFAP